VTHRDDHQALLERYLQQHLAGAVAGIEHLERMASRESDTETGRTLQAMAEDIRRDRERVRELARRLGLDPDAPVKKGMAWLAEKVAHVMVDPRVTSRSPLGRVLDLELMMSAVMGKRALWEALATVAEIDPRLSRTDIEQGVQSSLAQLDALLGLHRSAVRVAFADLRAEARQQAAGTSPGAGPG